jgi:hypothetical protein
VRPTPSGRWPRDGSLVLNANHRNHSLVCLLEVHRPLAELEAETVLATQTVAGLRDGEPFKEVN